MRRCARISSSSTSPVTTPSIATFPRVCIILLHRDVVVHVPADKTFDPKYNDLPLVFDADICKVLVENGVCVC